MKLTKSEKCTYLAETEGLVKNRSLSGSSANRLLLDWEELWPSRNLLASSNLLTDETDVLDLMDLMLPSKDLSPSDNSALSSS